MTVLELVLSKVRGKKVLDAGSGSGWAEKSLSEAGAESIDAYDIDKEMVDFSNSQDIDRAVYRVKDFNTSDFGVSKYDVVISMEIIEHIEKYEYYLRNMVKALKPKGLLFLSTPNGKYCSGVNKYHLKEFTVKEMKNLFRKNNLRLIKVFGIVTGNNSKLAATYIPIGIMTLIKKTFLYRLLVKHFANFPISETDPERAESLAYLCRKVSDV